MAADASAECVSEAEPALVSLGSNASRPRGMEAQASAEGVAGKETAFVSAFPDASLPHSASDLHEKVMRAVVVRACRHTRIANP